MSRRCLQRLRSDQGQRPFSARIDESVAKKSQNLCDLRRKYHSRAVDSAAAEVRRRRDRTLVEAFFCKQTGEACLPEAAEECKARLNDVLTDEVLLSLLRCGRRANCLFATCSIGVGRDGAALGVDATVLECVCR